MTPKKVGDLTVNDGKGLLDNDGLCDSLILDLNNLIKLILNGQYIQFSATVAGMAQKLVNLKKGVKDDLDAMKEKVEELKRMNDSLVEQMTGLPVDKDGDENGEN